MDHAAARTVRRGSADDATDSPDVRRSRSPDGGRRNRVVAGDVDGLEDDRVRGRPRSVKEAGARADPEVRRARSPDAEVLIAGRRRVNRPRRPFPPQDAAALADGPYGPLTVAPNATENLVSRER